VGLERDDLEHLAAVVKAACGVVLPPERANVVESRLGAVARREGFDSVGSLVTSLRAKSEQPLVRAIVDALTNAETQFFRDKIPFDQFRRDVLPALVKVRNGQPLRVLSAGCSTGQEAYSLAMVGEAVQDTLPGTRLDIIGVDVSDRRLEKARSGLYTQFEVQRGLPIRMLIDHFDKIDDNWSVGPRLAQSVRWGLFNLLHDPKPLGRFDVIFCRNVLPSFDDQTRSETLERLGQALVDDGVLFLGLAETVHGINDLFRPVPGRRGVYCKNPARLIRRVA
jgi:chemotaxis protein methyltransferase CheR